MRESACGSDEVSLGCRSCFSKVFGIGNGATLKVRGAELIPPVSLTAQTKSLEPLDLSAKPEIQSKGNRFVPVSWRATIRELRASGQHIGATAESTTFGSLTLDQNKSFSAN